MNKNSYCMSAWSFDNQEHSLLELLTAVCCAEIDGSISDYVHQVNQLLSDVPEEVRSEFIDCWLTVARCVSVNKK